MSRQRAGYSPVAPEPGPLFRDPAPARLTGNTDPATSRKAAGRAIADGTVRGDAAYLLQLIRLNQGRTMAFYGAMAAIERGGDAFQWRLKLGRRTGELLQAELVHTKGEQDGMALWFKGPSGEGR